MPTHPRPVVPPPLIANLMRELEDWRLKHHPTARVRWKRNAGGDYVLAVIVPAKDAVMVR